MAQKGRKSDGLYEEVKKLMTELGYVEDPLHVDAKKNSCIAEIKRNQNSKDPDLKRFPYAVIMLGIALAAIMFGLLALKAELYFIALLNLLWFYLATIALASVYEKKNRAVRSFGGLTLGLLRFRSVAGKGRPVQRKIR